MALERLIDNLDAAGDPAALYTDLRLPEPPGDRPYVFVNMVSTVDGKILIGPRGSTAKGVGGPTDQLLMRRLQGAADCAMIGSGTLRAGNVIYRPEMWRAVVTRSGDLPLGNRFFVDALDCAIVFAPNNLSADKREALETRANLRIVGETAVDLPAALRVLRDEFGISRLLVEGGADLNFDLFSAGLVDELFLSFAPKVKGGVDIPTIIEGEGLPGREWIGLSILSLYRDGDELYLRYRVGHRATS